jgi:tetratricopeptide (TPR) repeat protein
MSAFQRAMLLLEQSRPELAEPELRRHLTESPDDPMAHALLALCLAGREQLAEGTQEAEEAIRLAPDLAFAHYALASVLDERNRYDEAETSVREAIRLDPEEPNYHALLGQLHLNRRWWQDALDAANTGLALDPEHASSLNLRAMAEVKLGRGEDAAQTIDTALSRDPENPVTHANQGWALLHRGAHQEALEHFRESLRLDPTQEWAREGLVQALKARFPLYGLLLRYFLWMSTLPRGTQFAVIFGGMFAFRSLRGVARSNPDLAPFVTPLLVVYGLFVALTWTAEPLSNLLLRINRFGRYALSPEQLRASNWVGVCLLAALLSAFTAAVTRQVPFGLAAFCFLLLVMLVSATFRCAPGWPRVVMGLYSGAVAAFTLLCLAVSLAAASMPNPTISEDAIANGPIGLFVLALFAAIAGTWLATALAMVQPKR